MSESVESTRVSAVAKRNKSCFVEWLGPDINKWRYEDVKENEWRDSDGHATAFDNGVSSSSLCRPSFTDSVVSKVLWSGRQCYHYHLEVLHHLLLLPKRCLCSSEWEERELEAVVSKRRPRDGTTKLSGKTANLPWSWSPPPPPSNQTIPEETLRFVYNCTTAKADKTSTRPMLYSFLFVFVFHLITAILSVVDLACRNISWTVMCLRWPVLPVSHCGRRDWRRRRCLSCFEETSCATLLLSMTSTS